MKTEVNKKLVDSMSGRVRRKSIRRKKWTYEIVTDNEVHAAFLHIHNWESEEKNYVWKRNKM